MLTQDKEEITRQIFLQTLHHFFATHMQDEGTDVRYIQELLGHKDIKTTVIYTHAITAKMETLKSPLGSLNLSDLFGKMRNGDIANTQI